MNPFIFTVTKLLLSVNFSCVQWQEKERTGGVGVVKLKQSSSLLFFGRTRINVYSRNENVMLLFLACCRLN
jgi:hypothetical protein